MNEQAIQDSYNVFVSNGYTKSIDEFKKLINTNPQALKDSYDVFVNNGYTKSIDDYKVLMGVSSQSAPIVKKKDSSESVTPQPQKADTMVSSLEDGSLATQPTPGKKFSLTAEDLKGIGKKQPTDMSGKPLLPKPKESEKILSKIYKENQALEEEKKKFGDVFDNQLNIKPKVEESQYLKDRLSSIDTELINKTESFVVPKLQYQFGDLGFKFEEARPGRDYVKAIAPNGKTIEISLDNWKDETSKSESEILKKFIKENTPAKGLFVLEKTIREQDKKFNSDKQVDDSVKAISNEVTALNTKQKQFLIKKAQFEKDLIVLGPNPELEQQRLALNEEMKSILEEEETIKQKSKRLDAAVGKYSISKAKQGSWGGAIFNAINEGFSSISAGTSSFVTDIATEIAPAGFGMSQKDLKSVSIDIAKKIGVKGPSEEQTIEQWKKTLTKNQLDEWEDQVDDYIKKDIKSKTLPYIRIGNREIFGDEATTKEFSDLKEQGFWGGAILGVAKSLPAMIGGAGPAGWAQRTAQMYTQIADGLAVEMENDPQFANITENEKLAITLPIGITSAVLEAYGLRNVMASKGVINSITMSVLGKVGTGASAKTFRELVENEVESKIARGLITITAAGVAEFETGAAQEATETGFKVLYDEIKGKDMFNTPDSKLDFIENIAVAGAQEAIGGFVLGVPSGISAAYSKKGFLKMDDVSFETFANMANDTKMQSAYIASLKDKITQGIITEKEAKEELNNYRNSAGLYRQLPEGLTTQQKKEAMNLLKEKRDLENYVDGKDPALVSKQKNRITEINGLLTNLSEQPSAEYIINDKPYSKEEFLKELEGKTPDELKDMDIVVNNDEQTSKDINEKFKTNAIQEQTTDESVLRAEQPEVGLQEMGEGNAQPIEVTKEETKITNEPEEVKGTFLDNIQGKIYEYTDPITGDKLKGNIFFDGKEVVFTDSNKEFSLGTVQDILDSNTLNATEVTPNFNISEEGTITLLKETDGIPEGEIKPQGAGLKAIKTDKDGNVKRVVVTDANGVTHSIKGELANDLAEVMMFDLAKQGGLTKKINSDETARETFNRGVREANAKRKGKDTQTGVQRPDRGGRVVEPTKVVTPEVKAEAAPAEVDKIKSDIEASKERLKKAWDKYKTMGIAFDPKNNLARDKELVNSLVEYAYNNIKLGSYNASKFIKDLAEQGFEITKDGAKFIMDKASKKVQREVNKTIGVKPKPTEQKRINKAYAVGVATQKVATEEAKAKVKDLKGQVVDVFRAGIEAVKLAQTTAKEKARDIKTKSQELAKYLDQLKGQGKITADQASAMVKRFSKVNVLSEKSVNRFIDYVTKVLKDADYSNKLFEARKTLSSLKKLSKNSEKNADLRAVASEFTKIDPSMVENIDEYNEISEKLKKALEGSKIRKADVKFAESIDIGEVSSYVEKILTEQDSKLREEKIAELQSLLGVDASTFSAEEIDALLESDEEISGDDVKVVRAALNKAFDVYSTIIDEMINTGIDPFTGEEVELTDAQKKIIKEFMGIDLNTIEDNKEALRIIDSLINFIQNKSTAGMSKSIADYQAIVGGNELIRQKIEGKGIRKFWFKSVGKALAEQFTSLNLLFEREFKGFNAASKVRKMMGITDLVNGKSIGQTEANRIVKKYVDEFYNKKANGEAFNSAYNDIERGVFAHVYRSVIGSEKRRKAVFEKRKQEVLEAIKNLQKNGNEKERQLAELYKKAYDKILDGSENIEDVIRKTDVNNVNGVDYWVNQWANKFDALSDLALNFYNKILGRDLSFTPDRFSYLEGENKDLDLENDESAYIRNTDGVLYNKKSGSLMDKQEDRKTPKGMYIDLSFDSKNSNAMYDAMIDLNTAFNIRKVQSFLNSDNFKKIFKDDADLFRKRIANYVRLSRRKSPYTGSELSGLIKKLDKIATIGVTQALASPTQPFKQTIPVAASTLINSGSIGISAAFNPSYNAWLDKLGYAISSRGIESRAEIESINRLLEKAASSKKEKVGKFIREANEKMLKLTLVNPDVWIARASFKAYYEQYLKKQGLDYKNIDYSTHEVNDDAADYAQEMIDRQQNISDHDLAGDLFTDKNSITKATIKMLMAFSSFRMNQGSRLAADLTTLEYWNTSTEADKIIALRSIAGYTAEQAVFRGLQITFGMMLYYAAKAVMGRGDDDEEDKKFKNNLIKSAATGSITDTFSPLPLLDPYVQNLSAASVDAFQDIIEIPEEDKLKLFEANKQEFIKMFGIYGIVPEKASQIYDLGKLAYTRKFKDNYGNEKEISQEDADALKLLIGPFLASSVTGVIAPDVSSIVRKSVKMAQKEGKSTKETVAEFGDEGEEDMKELSPEQEINKAMKEMEQELSK